MNRDERRTRADEVAPRVAALDGGVRWIGPADGEAGGTWFGANDHGMVVCLLNAYAAEDFAMLGRDGVPSRGEIIPRLMGLSPDEALRWLDTEFDPSRYPSFTLVAATRTASVLYSWRLDSGISRTRMDAGWSMVTSSWWRTDEVVAWRTEIFERWCADGSPDLSGVPTFNLLEVADQREWSPMMTRSLSMTRSMTQAEIVDGEPEVFLRYWRRDHERPIDPACPTAVEALRLTSV